MAPTPLIPGITKVLAPSSATVADLELHVSVPASSISLTLNISGGLSLVAGVGAAEPSGRQNPTLNTKLR